MDIISLPSGSYLVKDKAYVDFGRLMRLSLERINFVLQAKDNMQYKIIYRRTVEKDSGVICDQIIELSDPITRKKYPKQLRRIRYYDKESSNTFVFITNNFKLSALTIAALYKGRWGIETFFKWIKQHLKILDFWGHSENAVRTQVWIAISTYVIVAIAKKKLDLSASLYEILQGISISAFDRIPIKNLFADDINQDVKEQYYNQLKMY